MHGWSTKAKLYKYVYITIAAASMCLGYLVALKIRITTTTVEVKQMVYIPACHIIGSNMHTIRRAHAESTHNTLRERWCSFRIHSGTLICSYSYVMNSFWCRFKFVFSSLCLAPMNSFVGVFFVRICACSSFVKFCPFVHGTLPQFVIV